MKRKRTGFALALAAAAMLALSGCGAMTPEKLAGKVRQALEKTPCTQSTLDMGMDMSMADPGAGIEMDLGFQMSGQLHASFDPDTIYEDLEITVEMMGLRVPTEMEVYIFPEDDKFASYTNVNGSWTRSEIDASQTNWGVSISVWNLPADRLSIDEEVTELEGTPATCLAGEISGSDAFRVVGFLFSSLGEGGGLADLEDIDWEKVSAQVTLYVDSETYLPLREEISVSGLEDTLLSLPGSDNVSLAIRNTTMQMEYISYEPAEPYALPEGAKEAAAQTERLLEGNPDNGDGTFTIQESGYYADIQAPEGYVLTLANYDEVDFYSEELDRLVCYQMWITDDSNDLFFWDLVSEEEYLYTGESYGPGRMADYLVINTDSFRFCLDGFAYYDAYIGGNYYAWANMDDGFYGWILVSIYDGGYTMDSSITFEEIQSLLGRVSPYQLPAAQNQMADILDKLEL